MLRRVTYVVPILEFFQLFFVLLSQILAHQQSSLELCSADINYISECILCQFEPVHYEVDLIEADLPPLGDVEVDVPFSEEAAVYVEDVHGLVFVEGVKVVVDATERNGSVDEAALLREEEIIYFREVNNIDLD